MYTTSATTQAARPANTPRRSATRRMRRAVLGSRAMVRSAGSGGFRLMKKHPRCAELVPKHGEPIGERRLFHLYEITFSHDDHGDSSKWLVVQEHHTRIIGPEVYPSQPSILLQAGKQRARRPGTRPALARRVPLRKSRREISSCIPRRSFMHCPRVLRRRDTAVGLSAPHFAIGAPSE